MGLVYSRVARVSKQLRGTNFTIDICEVNPVGFLGDFEELFEYFHNVLLRSFNYSFIHSFIIYYVSVRL